MRQTTKETSLAPEYSSYQSPRLEKEFDEEAELDALKRQVQKKIDWSGTKVEDFRTFYKKKVEGQIDDALLQGVQKIADQLLDNNEKAITKWNKDPAKV